MTEFVGRTGSLRLYSYPETPRGGVALLLARNYAEGPATDTTISSGGTQVPWDLIGSGAAPGVDVPITPRVTGFILITGVISLKNTTSTPASVQMQVQVDNNPLGTPLSEKVTVPGDGFVTIPILIQIRPAQAVGVLKNIEILLTADTDGVINITTDSSSLEIQEVLAPTG